MAAFQGTRRLFRFVVWACLLILLFSLSSQVFAAGTTSGTVFRDYNANGVQDAREPGIPNVSITAYDSAGVAYGPVLTNAAGVYNLAWGGADTTVRVEFTLAPPMAANQIASLQSGAFGPGSGTSVQFVSSGQTANLGLNEPSDYCQDLANVNLVTSCFAFGDQSGTDPVIISHPYLASGQGGGANVYHATAQQIGAVYGQGYQRSSNTLFVSSYFKRNAGFGPSGIGAIYSVPLDGPAGAVPTLLVNFDANGVDTGTDTHSTYFVVEGQQDAGVGPDAYPAPTSPYAQVGRASFGDMDISEDGTTLWVVNLFDRSLYSIDIATAAITPRGLIPSPGCTNGVGRPFGMGIRDGLVYIGGVCSGENGGTTADLQAYVYTFNPAGGGFSGAPVLQFPLNYPRGCGDVGAGYQAGGVSPLNCRTGQVGSLAEWQPWRNDWPNPGAAGGTGTSLTGTDLLYAYAQPMLAEIEFDGNDLILGFRDRMGDQAGWNDAKPGLFEPGNNLFTVSAGDILRASPNAALTAWTIENNAQSNPPGTFGPTVGQNNEQGPGNGEFFYQDDFFEAGTGFGHDEISNGGMALVPGALDVALSAMDPVRLITGGTVRLSLTGGGSPAGSRYEIFAGGTPNFGKANGLGDMEAICSLAPIEVGNYVWFDADQDGVQDPNETPIAGVQVQLVDALGNVIATATTDAQGRYFFSSDPNRTSTASAIYNLAALTPNTNFQVRINLNPAVNPALNGFTATTPNTGAGGSPDINDSDGLTNIAPGFSAVNFTTGRSGQNNHTYDFGFYTPPYSLGNRVWYDDNQNNPGAATNNDGLQNANEPGIGGVLLNLYRVINGVRDTVPFRQDTTTTNGYYLFDNLPPGDYVVCVAASNFAAGGPLNGLTSSTGAGQEANPNNDGDLNDNGLDVPVNGEICSGTVSLGPGAVEPTGETDIGPQGSGVAANDRSNLTVDFGFFGTPTTYSLGNRVWLDTNNNGLIDPGEQGIGNVVVNLYRVINGVPEATPFRTLVTDANGYYLFDNLPAGDYIVEIAPSNFQPGGPLNGLLSSDPDETDPNNDGDSNDNGIGSAPSATLGIRSGIVTLGPGTTEPTNETDLGPGGSGIAANNRSNLTVDFGFYGTLPSAGQPITAGPRIVDPAIVKLSDPAFAQPGERVTWTIIITNPNAIPLSNVGFVDSVPAQLEILRWSTTAGNVSVNGQTVTYTIDTLQPLQEVRITLETRIRPETQVPFIITNLAEFTGGYSGRAEATVSSAGALPSTGFGDERLAVVLAGLVVALIGLVVFTGLRQRSRMKALRR
jgi:uncharacterized repeat protein (TIGR01451 family)